MGVRMIPTSFRLVWGCHEITYDQYLAGWLTQKSSLNFSFGSCLFVSVAVTLQREFPLCKCVLLHPLPLLLPLLLSQDFPWSIKCNRPCRCHHPRAFYVAQLWSVPLCSSTLLTTASVWTTSPSSCLQTKFQDNGRLSWSEHWGERINPALTE